MRLGIWWHRNWRICRQAGGLRRYRRERWQEKDAFVGRLGSGRDMKMKMDPCLRRGDNGALCSGWRLPVLGGCVVG